MDALVTGLNTAVSGLADSLTGVISSNAPVLMAVFGGLVAIGIVIKVVRRVTGH